MDKYTKAVVEYIERIHDQETPQFYEGTYSPKRIVAEIRSGTPVGVEFVKLARESGLLVA